MSHLVGGSVKADAVEVLVLFSQECGVHTGTARQDGLHHVDIIHQNHPQHGCPQS